MCVLFLHFHRINDDDDQLPAALGDKCPNMCDGLKLKMIHGCVWPLFIVPDRNIDPAIVK